MASNYPKERRSRLSNRRTDSDRHGCSCQDKIHSQRQSRSCSQMAKTKLELECPTNQIRCSPLHTWRYTTNPHNTRLPTDESPDANSCYRTRSSSTTVSTRYHTPTLVVSPTIRLYQRRTTRYYRAPNRIWRTARCASPRVLSWKARGAAARVAPQLGWRRS